MSEFPIQELNGVAVVACAGRLDALVAGPLDEALKQALSDGHVHLVVDMAHVSYVSSSCLRVLLIAARAARQGGGDLKLCCLSPRVHQVFVLAGFDLVFQLCETQAQALAAYVSPDGLDCPCASG